MRHYSIFQALVFSVLLFISSPVLSRQDGGMYPISMLDKLPLKKAGLKIPVNEIYNPNGQALMQAVVQIGGCSGSFVSGKGLVITNHHCAFGGLQAYSSTENNLLEKGYLAKDMKRELPVKGLKVKILESYDDVSDVFITAIGSVTDAVEKKAIIADTRKDILQMEKLKHPDMNIEVSEMLPNKNYMVFRYKLFTDVRIVYIPARNIGEFGGETDNWEWPRHTGDFSFMRVYTGKDGQPAEFDSSNVPYEPKEYLNISKTGVEEGDFVFILGYPGRTFRHQPAEFIRYQEQYQLPYISNLYEWQIATIKRLGEDNDLWQISNESRIKRLANVEKNYEGKIKSLGELNLYEKKKAEERKLISDLTSRPALQKEYRDILDQVDAQYAQVNASAMKYLYYNQLLNENNMLKIAYMIGQFRELYPELKDSTEKLDRVSNEVVEKLRSYYRALYIPYDSVYLFKMLSDGVKFREGSKLPYVMEANLKKLKQNYSATRLLDSTYIFGLILDKPKKLVKLDDPYLDLSRALYEDYMVTDSVQTRYRAELDALLPRYVDIKMEAMGQTFIPDANSTLRFTYGYIKGYAPRDAVYYQPITTVSGMIAKDGIAPDYNLNERLEEIYRNSQKTKYISKGQGDIPLCILYNTDTTGGNSGSPILNKFGQLIGVNFDRSYEATVNDFAWDDEYSRSIGLDIRFVLWMLSDVANAGHLMDEMFIDQ